MRYLHEVKGITKRDKIRNKRTKDTKTGIVIVWRFTYLYRK